MIIFFFYFIHLINIFTLSFGNSFINSKNPFSGIYNNLEERRDFNEYSADFPLVNENSPADSPSYNILFLKCKNNK